MCCERSQSFTTIHKNELLQRIDTARTAAEKRFKKERAVLYSSLYPQYVKDVERSWLRKAVLLIGIKLQPLTPEEFEKARKEKPYKNLWCAEYPMYYFCDGTDFCIQAIRDSDIENLNGIEGLARVAVGEVSISSHDMGVLNRNR